MDEYGGKFPEEPKDILGLAGIGAYTAGAVGSICFGNRDSSSGWKCTAHMDALLCGGFLY